MTRADYLLAAALTALLALSGCNKAESPDKVAKDVANATAEAQKRDERSEQKAEQTDARVTSDLSKQVDKANEREARAAADDAIVQAEGQNKIALAKCEALAGDAQQSCKDQANAELEAVRKRAKELKVQE